MKLTGISLTNFRSYAAAEFALHPEVTLVVGPNASGKTNLLESLYVLATTKSFRAADRDLVRRGSDFLRIVASGSETEYALGLSVAPVMEKRVSHNGDKRTLAAHIGELQITLFEPDHLNILSGAPEGRRRYLDFILCQTDRGYIKTLQAYKRVLRHRNALLEGSDGRGAVVAPGAPGALAASGAAPGATGALAVQLFPWNLKLTELAMEIVSRRAGLVGALNKLVPGLYAGIAGSEVELFMEYLPGMPLASYGDDFLAALERNLRRDMAAGFTTIGPHREDWRVSFNGAAVGSVASRVETRTLVLALKLAEMDYLEARSGRRPLLLLDDVFSELDHNRRVGLLERLSGHQSVITTTDADSITRDIAAEFAIVRPEDRRGEAQ